MKIRELSTTEERSEISLPIQAYAFQPSPADERLKGILRRNQHFYEGNETGGMPQAGVKRTR